MRSRLRSPMVSDHEHNWGQLGLGECHALRGLWSPMVSDHEPGGCHALGPVVSRVSGLRSPTVSDHEHNCGQHEPGGCHALGPLVLTRFGPVVFPQKELFGALSSEKSATRLARRVARAWVRGRMERNGAGWVSRGPWFSWFWK